MPLSFKEVTYTYSPDTPYEYQALRGINVNFTLGKITAIIGNTGSGKSTMIQHLNGLLLPTSGEIEVLDRTIRANEKLKDGKSLKKTVGLVFQFPEYQLFEETVLKDVMFGPQNFKVSEEEAKLRAVEALKLVGIPETYLEKSPLELSGGEKRKVAIAGILAMEPEILVLDEPVAGLDPQSAQHMMELFRLINQKYHKTVLLVTHNMEQVLTYCDEVAVVKDGVVIHHGDVKEFFREDEILDELGIEAPMIIKAKRLLKQQNIVIPDEVLDIPSLAKAIAKAVKK
ncbi:MAG: energy-coupling factor transporter ATPase [Erysipelotrichaceae bacterium]|nr:energy-coupling factor transporter ATPase [Erysipelotrichaceae bacterium]